MVKKLTMHNMKFNNEYKKWLINLKSRIRQSQIKAANVVNTALIEFYWDLGKMISEKETAWGSKLIEQVAKDLKQEFPDMQGLSRSNLFNAKKFYQFYNNTQLVQQPVGLISKQTAAELQVFNNKQNKNYSKLVQQLVRLIPWGHNILIFTKVKELKEALFYIQKTKENNWSRDTLALQIKSGLYARQGKAITNFISTLPEPNSDLAQQTLKDPYVFDFLQLTEDYKERDIENQLMRHITRFLLELGKGFAFVGKQYNIQLNQKEYFIDILFYNIPMQCYVVVELKNKDFEPEFAGKLNFYLTLIDKTMKRPNENPTIGILLCRGKDNLEVEYALQDIHKPMGVSEFKLDKVLPDNLKSSLPSIEELEEQIKKMDDV
jgi:predicted nuclease of restriction endonuclease-like (RecB) superfamily